VSDGNCTNRDKPVQPFGGSPVLLGSPVRGCGMEAGSRAQHRMKMNSRKADLTGLACPETRRPISSRVRFVLGAAAA